MKPVTNVSKYFAEGMATFFMIFAGTGAIVVNEIYRGTITHVGISLVFGLAVMAMIYSFGPISGAHMNPAVTIALWFVGRTPKHEVPRYIFAQISGAVLASATLRILFLHQPTHLGITLPSGPWWQSFLLEFFLTALLMFIIMAVATRHGPPGVMASVTIGATIAVEALFGGPVSGASMNPARSFGPALVSGVYSHHWIYWIAPLLGALAGARLFGMVVRPIPKPSREVFHVFDADPQRRKIF